jgi:two-component system, cell cycle sensor histidine kinase and response regulator CckA
MPIALIVDDKEEGLYLLECLLSSNGYRVITASNGQEALDRAGKILPDLIISDILMPVMDGFMLCRRWKQDERFRSIPFIFYTATYTDARDEEFALNLGADLFLVKPKDPEVFMQIIEDFLEKHRKGELLPSMPALKEESNYLQTYNSALVRKLEEKLLQLEEANKALGIKDFAIATSIAGVVMSDLLGKITYVNHAFAEMWGCESAEFIGKSMLDLAWDKDVVSTMIEKLRFKGHWIGELNSSRRGGLPFIVQVVAHMVTGSNFEPICIMASCIDITERKRLEEENQRNQNLEALSLFAAGISHDFNNLLTGLFNSLELAREELPPGNPAEKHFAVAISVFERARDLAQNLLTFAKGGSTLRRPVSVSNIIRESCTLSLSGSAIRHEFLEDEHLALVEANANQLSQVFNNIIINARQAMGDSGILMISAGHCDLQSDQIGKLPKGNYVVIRFEDNGPGIPETLIPKIFNPFFSTKVAGSGLGLATSYSIVKNHGGHIQASSRPGGGARFEIWLPAQQGEKPQEIEALDLESARGSGHILIMDDEEGIRSIAQALLGRAGYEVAVAANGKEALDLYRAALTSGNPFDAVILDLTIRGGIGGERTLSELLKINPHVVAIASTGYSNSATLAQLKQSGFAGSLPKPYTKFELLSVVKSATSRIQASRR